MLKPETTRRTKDVPPRPARADSQPVQPLSPTRVEKSKGIMTPESPGGRRMFRRPKPEDMDYASVENSPARSMSSRNYPQLVGSRRHQDEASVLSDDVSHAMSVASDTLGAIMSRIEEAKAQLEENSQSKDVESQVELAKLIEKLASAAVAVRKLEEL